MVKRWGGVVVALGLSNFAPEAAAQHSIYKCVVGGKITYSNEPCPDAKKIEIKQTKGVNYTGKVVAGPPRR